MEVKDKLVTLESLKYIYDLLTSVNDETNLSIQELTERVNAVLNSDDDTLDQMSEIIAYIKSNKELIDAVTTSKVNVADIINNLTTNIANKPLSAAQGVALKSAIDALGEIVEQMPGCYVVNATPSGDGYIVDRTTSEIRGAVDAGNDVRIHDIQSGMYHHITKSDMLSAQFFGIEYDSIGATYVVAYLVSNNNTAIKDTIQIPSGADITELVMETLDQAKASGEFDGTPGADGGYYTIDLEQLSSQNVKISFTPSRDGMPSILPEVITLPQGPQGDPGTSPTVSVSAITGGHRITITDANGTKTIDVMDGEDGDPGKAGNGIKSAVLNADYTLTLTFDDGTSYTTPSIRGTNGADGRGIKSIAKTSGTGAAGTTDTYTITYTDNTTSTFTVYNGKNGANGSPGANGYTPVKGVDYWTDADKAEIASEVFAEMDEAGYVSVAQGVSNAGKVLMVDANGNLTLTDVPEMGVSGDIVGVVSQNKEIVLTGVLPEGVYTLKYQAEDGTMYDAGSINLESEQVVPITLHSGKIDYNNGGAIVASDTYLYTDFIEKGNNKAYKVSLVGEGSCLSIKVVYYDANGDYLSTSENNYPEVTNAVTTGTWSVPLIEGAAKFRLRIYHRSADYVAMTMENFVLTQYTIKYTNVLATSTDADGSIYQGKGYVDGYRLGSYSGNAGVGGLTATANHFTSGFIPYTNEQAKNTIPFYIKGVTLDIVNLPQYIRYALTIPGSADWFGVGDITDMTNSNQFTITQLGDKYYMFKPNGNVYTYQAWNTKNTTHIRFTLPGSGEGVIITVDEPIG